MSGLVGLLGGTFNPVHLGHLRAAEEAAEQLDLERVLFVPAADPPLKRGGAQQLAPARDRLAWVRTAIADNPRFEASAIELEREGVSYTVDTLRALRKELAPAELVFLVGQDAFLDLGLWREMEALPTLAHFAVVTRPPGGGRLADWLPEPLVPHLEVSSDGDSARHRASGHWIRRLCISALDISSTDLRARLRDGRSVRYLVPEGARGAVEASGAYRGADSSARDSSPRDSSPPACEPHP